MEYIKADDIRNIIFEIEPTIYDYFNIGIIEENILYKQQEIADMLKRLEVVEVEK